MICRNRSNARYITTTKTTDTAGITQLTQLQEIKDALMEMHEDRKILRIGAAPMFSQLVLPGILQGFTALYPNIYPNIRTGLSSIEYEWLKSGEIQMAFIRGNYTLEGFEAYTIGREPLCIISKNPLPIRELPNHPLIIYDTDLSLSQQINAWVDETFSHQKLYVGMRVGDSQTCIRVVSQGSGYAIVPYYLLSDWGIQNLCVCFLRDRTGNIITRATSLLYSRKEYQLLESVRSFVDFVRQYFPDTVTSFLSNSP